MKLYFLDMSCLMIGRRMKCVHTLVATTLYLLVVVLGNAKGDILDITDKREKLPRRDTDGECYRAEFSEDVWPCPDFENQVMKCDPLELGMVEGKEGELGLQGTVGLDAEIEDGTMMNVEIWKIIDIGKEYLYHAQGDICGSLKDTNTPWFPLIDAMKISECPIAVKSYEIKDMVLNLAHAKDMLTHEMCGEFLIQMSMTKEIDKLACYELGIAISEYSCNKTADE